MVKGPGPFNVPTAATRSLLFTAKLTKVSVCWNNLPFNDSGLQL